MYTVLSQFGISKSTPPQSKMDLYAEIRQEMKLHSSLEILTKNEHEDFRHARV